MKNLLFIFCLGFLVSCNQELIEEPNIDIDLSLKVNVNNWNPKSEFDHTSKGIYKGVFTSIHSELHGEILLNLGNDDTYLAQVTFTNGTNAIFKPDPGLIAQNHLLFRNQYGQFKVFTQDNGKAMVTDVIYKNKNAHIIVKKERSYSKVAVALGTYVDDSDVNFNGTWDLIAEMDDVGPFFNVSEVLLCHDNGTPEGVLFQDNMTECFDFNEQCIFEIPPPPVSSVVEVRTDCGDTTGNLYYDIDGETINVIILPLQISNFAGNQATWELQFLRGSMGNPNEYYELLPGNNCNTTSAGKWSWNGRTGSILLN